MLLKFQHNEKVFYNENFFVKFVASKNNEPVANCDRFKTMDKTMESNLIQQSYIQDRIIVIRDVQVMIDRDLAELYGVETKRLNEQVKRNVERFPKDFMFQLSGEEKAELVTNCDRFNTLKHSTATPYAFTEQGVAMLSSILKSKTAVDVNIKIMRAFVSMRHFIQNNARVFAEIDNIKQHLLESNIHHKENDKKISELFDLMANIKLKTRRAFSFRDKYLMRIPSLNHLSHRQETL